MILAILGVCGVSLSGIQSSDTELATSAEAVLIKRCSPCHGTGSPGFKGVFVDDYRRLVGPDKAVVPGNPNSKLLEMVRTGRMPLGGEKLPEEEIQLLQAWVLRGAPSWGSAPGAPRPNPLSESQVIRLIEGDLSRVPERDQRFLRYFTLAHLDNAGVTQVELTRQREALAKLLNSLAWRRTISTLKPIDAGATVLRIDLRDFDWDERTWNRIVQAYPYAILRREYRVAQDLTGTRVPYVRGDWFVAAASVPPLYHEILGLPNTVAELERMLGLDTARNLEQEKFVVRAAVRNSGVSRNNRALERHETSYGAYWKSYDFTSSAGGDNIFQNPLNLRPAGGEIIFNLPNGMQAYFLANGRGNRLDRAPTEIVFDRNDPERPEIINGRSCMSCHFAGMRTFRDDARAVISQQAELPDRDRALALYVEQPVLDKLLEEDAARFRQAVLAAGGRIPEDPRTEPVGAVARRFEAPLGIELAAAELGLQPGAIRVGIESRAQLRDFGFGQLLVESGSIKRDLWEEKFPDVVQTLSLGEPQPVSRRPRIEARGNSLLTPALSRPGGLAQNSRTVAITSRTVWFKPTSLEEQLVENADFKQAGLQIVNERTRADLIITIDRPVFTFDWTYAISDRETARVLSAGKVTAAEGEAAARLLAKQIGQRLNNHGGTN